ncbi:MAG TPA: hypothetical protein IAC25_02515 [Candidatus Enterenecus stercoripullorum]|nr:hypothetical protein [Candidatus Enterenecus stercoripullorum]
MTNVVAGNKAAIAVTAATDPDGTIASYIYDRSVDGSAWQQIANVNARSYQDMVSADWGTVAYRVCAVDNDGASGPYVTSNTSVVNSGWVILSGPADAMGSKPAPFEFAVTPSISGVTQSSNISVEITLDGVSVYSQAVRAGTEITVGIDTRIMKTGNHSIVVTGTCAGYVPASKEYTFSVPSIDLSDGGRLEQLEGPDGQAIFPVTLPRAVVGLDVYGVESKVHSGAYTGSGTYGSGNRNTLNFDFEPKLVIIQGTSGRTAILTKPSGIGVSIGPSDTAQINVTWNGNSVSWYSRQNAANQMNTNSESYSYTAFG